MDEHLANLILATDPDVIFTPLNGPVARCPQVGERYRSPYDVVEVKAIVNSVTQRLTLEVVERSGKPFET